MGAERVLAANAIARPEETRVSIENINPGGVPHEHLDFVTDPAVGEVGSIVGGAGRGVLRVGALRRVVIRDVVAGQQVEGVIHVVLPGVRSNASVTSKEVDNGVGAGQGIDVFDFHSGPGQGARRLAVRGP